MQHVYIFGAQIFLQKDKSSCSNVEYLADSLQHFGFRSLR